MIARVLSPLAPSPILAAILAVCAVSASARAAEPTAPSAEAGVYRMKLGAFTVVALSDGDFALPTRQLLIEDRPGRVAALLARNGLPADVPTATNAYLIDTGRKRVLVDAGSGGLLGPDLGKLTARLRAAGYAPEQIDEVLITHLHPDHVGGLSSEGRRVFPDATVRVDADESAFWLDKANAPKVDDSVKGAFDGAIASLQPYQAAGRIKTFKAGMQLAPGIRAVELRGHTAGHTAYRVESQGETLLLWGDVVHVQAVQFPAPQVTIHFDSTPAAAEATRERAYADAARQGYWVAGSHLAFPGIGHVVTHDGRYAWHGVEETK